jgi:hypothetical protein
VLDRAAHPFFVCIRHVVPFILVVWSNWPQR